MASTVEWMLVQICLCRKYKKFGQQGIQKKMLPFESSQVLQAGREKHWLGFVFNLFIFCVQVLWLCITVYAVPEEGVGVLGLGLQIVVTTMWVLGTKLWSSRKAVCVLNH